MGCFQIRLLYYGLLYALLLGLLGRSTYPMPSIHKDLLEGGALGWTIPPLDQGNVHFFSQILHQVSASFWSSDVFCENPL